MKLKKYAITTILEFIKEQQNIENRFNDDFNNWFNGSKIVDTNGKPLELYHGSPEEFEEFDGITFFTDDWFNADGYAGEDGVIYEVYLSIKNPLIIDAKNKKWNELDTPYGTSTVNIISKVNKNKYDGVIFNNIKDNWIDDEDYQDSATIWVHNSLK